MLTSLQYVHGLYDTTYHNRRRAFDVPDAASLETSDAQITEDYVDRDICYRYYVSAFRKSIAAVGVQTDYLY